MTNLTLLIDAIKLPQGARVDMRIPKKSLVEQGAPTAADKKLIQDGIKELQWVAALKPNTIAIPAAVNQEQDYSEIAVLTAELRATTKTARLIELIHRAIPYPVFLITSGPGGCSLSVAPKRQAQNEAAKKVVERVVSIEGVDPLALTNTEQAFVESLALERLPARDLGALYLGWLARIEALAAARLSGVYAVANDENVVARRREALQEHSRLIREMGQLCSDAKKSKQISQKVELNQKIKAIEASLDSAKNSLLRDH